MGSTASTLQSWIAWELFVHMETGKLTFYTKIQKPHRKRQLKWFSSGKLRYSGRCCKTKTDNSTKCGRRRKTGSGRRRRFYLQRGKRRESRRKSGGDWGGEGRGARFFH